MIGKSTARELRAENERLRASLREVLDASEKTQAGNPDTAWYALGAIQAVACRELGISWDAWRAECKERRR